MWLWRRRRASGGRHETDDMELAGGDRRCGAVRKTAMAMRGRSWRPWAGREDGDGEVVGVGASDGGDHGHRRHV